MMKTTKLVAHNEWFESVCARGAVRAFRTSEYSIIEASVVVSVLK